MITWPAGRAWAGPGPGWDSRLIYEGQESEEDGESDSYQGPARAVTLRQHGPSGRVYLLLEKMGGPWNERSSFHHLSLAGFQCGGATCAPSTSTPLYPTGVCGDPGGTDPIGCIDVGLPGMGNTLMLPSLVLRAGGGAVSLHALVKSVVAGTLAYDCDGDGVAWPDDTLGPASDAADLYHVSIDPVAGTYTQVFVAGNAALMDCVKPGVSTGRAATGKLGVDYTLQTAASVCQQQVQEQPWLSAWGPATALTPPVNVEFEHGSFDYVDNAGTSRVVAYRGRPIGPLDLTFEEEIQLWFPEGSTPGAYSFGFQPAPVGEDRQVDYPSVEVWNSRIRLVYSDQRNLTGAVHPFDYIRYKYCNLTTSNCESLSDWIGTDVVEMPKARHPELAVDGSYEGVLFMGQALDDTNLYYSYRCGLSEPFRPPELVFSNSVEGDVRFRPSIDAGRPHLALDRQRKVVHVALLEGDNFGLKPELVHSRVHWLARSYAQDCL